MMSAVGKLASSVCRSGFRRSFVTTSRVARGGDHAPDYVHAKHMYDLKAVRVYVCVCVGGNDGGVALKERETILGWALFRIRRVVVACTLSLSLCVCVCGHESFP